ncbi:MAG: hypothetical protein CMN27_11850 [Salinisphaera sp.]|nr:hypothetical protein [Salinisphaera sp.]
MSLGAASDGKVVLSESPYDAFLVYMEALQDKGAHLSKFFSRDSIEFYLDGLTDNREIGRKLKTLQVARNNLRFGDQIGSVLRHDVISVSEKRSIVKLVCASSGEQFTLDITYVRNGDKWLIDTLHYGAPVRYPSADAD